MKLLLDHGLPRSTVEILRTKGVDVVHTGEIGLAQAEDPVILERARQETRIVVTLDADFHMWMALQGATRPSVIRIRIEGLRAGPLAKLLLALLKEYEEDLQAGALVSVEETRVRLRRLPL